MATLPLLSCRLSSGLWRSTSITSFLRCLTWVTTTLLNVTLPLMDSENRQASEPSRRLSTQARSSMGNSFTHGYPGTRISTYQWVKLFPREDRTCIESLREGSEANLFSESIRGGVTWKRVVLAQLRHLRNDVVEVDLHHTELKRTTTGKECLYGMGPSIVQG